MKSRSVRLASALVCLALVLATIFATRIELSGSSSSIILYYNDRQWTLSSRMPVEVNTSGVYYVPLTVFAQLPSVSVRVNETLQTFIITHGDLYLSFDTVSNFAANQDMLRTPITTYERSGERYVPVAIVCAYLELGYEEALSSATGAVALRISDGSEEYSFRTLLRRQHPGFYPDETATEPPDTTPDTTPPVVVPPTLTDRVIYLTIEDSPGEYTDEILEVLKEYGQKATFFVVGDKAAKSADTLSKIAAGGHVIALHTMSHDPAVLTDGDAILADIEAENELLSKLIKQKSRIWRAPSGSSELASLTDEVRAMLADEGYIIWDGNVTVPSSYGAYSASNSAIRGIRNNEVAVLRFTESANTASALRYVLDFIDQNSDACEVRTISPAFDEYYS